jgi:predicted permease
MTDLRAALRLFATRRAFCSAVVLTLAVGLGSATAVFSVFHAIVLRSLPFPDAGRIVVIEAEVAGDRGRLALRELRDLERDARTLARIGPYYRTQYNVTGGGPPDALTCTMPSSAMFDVLGIRPAKGEIWPAALDFTRQYTVVLSHGLWQQRFGGRDDIVGQSIVMDGGTYRITGVMPASFDFPLQTDVYRALTDYNAPHVRRYSAVARLADGRTLADVQGELDALSARFAGVWPETNRGVRLRATPLSESIADSARPFVWMMTAAVVLLLTLACANVVNLLLSHALARRGDSAVRLALGAGRGAVARQPFIEALLLSLAGGILGAIAARVAVQALTRLVGTELPPWMAITVDGPVLAVGMVIALVVAVAIAALPALQASRTNVEQVLRQEAGRAAGSGAQRRGRRWLVAAQAALASLLLVAAGTFAAGVSGLLSTDPGFEARAVATFRVDPPYSRYGDIASTSEFYRRASEALATIPGVTAVGTNTNLPFARLDVASPRVTVEGRQAGRADEEPFVNFQVVSPDYFSAMGIRRHAGRFFERTDDQQAPAVAIVSQRAAQRFWGGDPLGRRLRVTWNQQGVGGGGGSEVWLNVVGVVDAVRFGGMDDVTGIDVYVPHSQVFAGDSYFVLRTALDPAALKPQVRAALDAVDREQSFFDVSTMADRIRRTMWHYRVSAAVLTAFAAIALALAVVGTYAVTAHAVAAQRREIGVRLALGSSTAGVGWLVARTWTLPVLCGVAVGLAGGVGGARLIAGRLGMSAPDVGWPLLLPLALAIAAAVACYVPVWRTVARLGLTAALRAE